jgi:hypothetical protein
MTDRETVNYLRRKKTVDRIQSARDILYEGGFDGYEMTLPTHTQWKACTKESTYSQIPLLQLG